MITRDWRGLPPTALAPLYEREQRRWLADLHWDSADLWATIEQARVTWGLPGLVAVDPSGHLRGSLFYLHAGNRFDVGGVTADTPAATCALLNGLAEAAALAHVREVVCFSYEGAPGLALELAQRDFAVETFLYLSRPLDSVSLQALRPASAGQRLSSTEWQALDVGGVTALLERAYDGPGGRHLVPEHTPAEWARYLRNLVDHTACGAINARATRIARRDHAIVGAVIVTAIARDTAHVAQVAVLPALRGEGLATGLVEEACAIAAGQGFTEITLLVAAGNRSARRLYERLGFSVRSAFVAAHRGESAVDGAHQTTSDLH